MPQRDKEISRLYLELAVECLGKAAATRQDNAAALKQMAHRYFAQALALNPSLSDEFANLDESISPSFAED